MVQVRGLDVRLDRRHRVHVVCIAAVDLGALDRQLPAAAVARDQHGARGELAAVAVEGVPDGPGLRVKRLDNGGVLDLRWDHLSAACALAIKQSFDLVGENQDEALVRCDEVEYVLNGSKQTQIGKIVETTNDTVTVQAKGVAFRIPKDSLRAVRSVEVPVAQVQCQVGEFVPPQPRDLIP